MTNDKCSRFCGIPPRFYFGAGQMTNECPMTNDKLKIWILSLIWILSFGFCHSGFSGSAGQPVSRQTGKLKKGQSVFEMSLLLVLIAVALIAMQAYLKRGIQGRLRGNADNIGEQYDPARTTSDFLINHVSNTTTTTMSADEQDTQRLLTNVVSQTHYDNTTRNGYEYVGAP